MKQKKNVNKSCEEYKQLRDDIRHTNTLFHQIFFLLIAIFGLLFNVIYNITSDQNIDAENKSYLISFIIVVGLVGLIVAFYVIYSLWFVRKTVFNLIERHLIADFLKEVKLSQKLNYLVGKIIIILIIFF